MAEPRESILKAVVLFPTGDQMERFADYISSAQGLHQSRGAVKVVPPAEWRVAAAAAGGFKSVLQNKLKTSIKPCSQTVVRVTDGLYKLYNSPIRGEKTIEVQL